MRKNSIGRTLCKDCQKNEPNLNTELCGRCEDRALAVIEIERMQSALRRDSTQELASVFEALEFLLEKAKQQV